MGMAVLISACGGSSGSTSSLTYSQTVTALTDEGLASATKGNTVSDAYNALLTLDISASDVDVVDTTLKTFVDAFAAYNTNIQNVRSYGITTFALSASESVVPPTSTKGKPGTSVPGSVGMLAGQTLADFHDTLTAKKAACDAFLVTYKATNASDLIARAEALQAYDKCAVELQALGAKEGFKIVVVKGAGGVVGGATGKIVGTMIVYYAVGAAALATPAGLLVIAATTIGGGIIGSKTAGAIFDYCTGDAGTSSTSKTIESGEYCTVASASGTTDTAMAMVTSPGTGTLQVFVEGYAPVSIAGVSVAAGQTLTVNVALEALTDVTDDSAGDVSDASTSTTTASAVATASSCADVVSVIATNVPVSPAAGQSVAVTATAIPVISGCTLSYTVAGTDDYAAASSPTTDAAGQITFTIPGGAANVHDVVTITESASGNTTTLGYAFQ